MTPLASTATSPVRATGWVARFPTLSPPVSTAGAAVTIVLRDGRTDVEVLVIERANNPRDPASGDVALPGGHVDERDGSLAETALRELGEEVGLSRTDLGGPLRFVGPTPARRFGLVVGVFAAELAERAPGPTIGSPTEVAHVFWLPRTALSQRTTITRDGGPNGPFSTFGSVHDGHLVWGFTRRVLREFFDLPQEGGGPPAGSPTEEPGRSTIDAGPNA